MKHLPRISIITIAFNDREGLCATILSVLTQTYPNIEYIVIDGGSTDGSKNLIEQNAPSLEYWVSEPDKGIYDAINKGIKRCNGDWVIFMNSGDEFVSHDVVTTVFTCKIPSETQFIYGDCIVKHENYQVLRKCGSINALWTGQQFSHQSIFIRGDFQRKNYYKLDNRIAADFELFFTAHHAGLKFKKLSISIARISPGGLSDRSRLESLAARYRIVRRLIPSLKIHLYFLKIFTIEIVKHIVKRWLPEQWINRYRRTKGSLV